LSKKVAVYLPEHLYEGIKHRLQKGRFKTVEEYVEFVLAEIIRDETPGHVYTHQEEEEIKERLRRLGYS
jgi:Arc/MetJ-type ribon-helix-helix transcriptional regulator